MASSEDGVYLQETAISHIPEIVERVRAGFRTHKTLEYDYRVTQLRNLKKLLEENEKQILAALKADLNKNLFEACLQEYGYVMAEVVAALNNLSDWMSPQHKPRDLFNMLNSVYVQPEPYGVLLIMTTWNYPFQLAFAPLAGAIAAGNACVIKPSELSVATSNLIAELVPRYLDQECYAVVTGGIEVSQAVLKERYDFIMCTGSTPVGKIVMKEAATHLTPVLLELGGKCPVIVAGDANLETAGRRIVAGRFTNAGQFCVAPDYVLCMRDQQDKLVEVCKKTIQEFYGENPKDSPDLGRMVNARHFKRVVGLIEGSKGTVAYGGDTDEQTRYIQPTLITDVTPDEKLMQEEIFGPVLPFVAVDTLDEAIEFVNSREKPLAMYVFTDSKPILDKVNKFTSAGGVCHNDTVMHVAVPSLPFGGVGSSGMGVCHYKHSFDTFSHLKGVLSMSSGLEGLNKIRYPPFTQTKVDRLRWLLFPKEKSGGGRWRWMALFLVVAAVAATVQMYGLPSWLYEQ